MHNDIKESSVRKCPYWSKNNNHECKMTKGGLYIPMSEHVDMYCSKSLYAQCHQYIRGCELLQETAKKYGFIVDGGRRRFRRVTDSIPLAISLCDMSKTPLEMIDDKAITIDLSLGGLRVASHAMIPKDTLISFKFSSNFSTPDLAGTGKVKWCEARPDNDTFEAGIAFSDFSLTQAIGAHLGLPMM